jgi:hypothetical protein
MIHISGHIPHINVVCASSGCSKKHISWTKLYEAEDAKLESNGRRPENQRPASLATPVYKSVISLDPHVHTLIPLHKLAYI